MSDAQKPGSKQAKQYTSDIIRKFIDKKGGEIYYNNSKFEIGKDKKTFVVTHKGEEGESNKIVEKNLKKYFGVNPYDTLDIVTEKGSVRYGYEVIFQLMPRRKQEDENNFEESYWKSHIGKILSS